MTLYLNYWTLASFCLLITTAPYWPVMPGWLDLIYCFILLLIAIQYQWLRIGVGAMFGVCIVIIYGNILIHQTETVFHTAQDSTITGVVDSNFKPTKFGYQGLIIIRSINGRQLGVFSRPKIRLNAPIQLERDATFSAQVSFKPMIGLLNSVGFDAEKQAFIDGVVGSATVTGNTPMYMVSKSSYRRVVIEQSSQSIERLEHSGIVRALLFAQRDQLSKEIWLALKQSGLTHLIAISGLHIGIVFSVGWGIGLLVFRMAPNAKAAPICIGFLCACCYTWLAGFTLPTQRALIMCLLFCLIQSRWGDLGALNKWLLTLSVLLILDPFSSQSMSLWLSMYAVGVILFVLSMRGFRRSWLFRIVVAQIVITLSMAPLLATYFNGLSLGSLLYNLVFIPWFSVVVIPLAFLALLTTFLSLDLAWLWKLLDLSLEPVVYSIGHASWGWIELSDQQTELLWTAILSVFLSLWLNRYAALFVTLILFLSLLRWYEKPDWRMTVLDVGHGLAVVVEQEERALVYDVGDSWGEASISSNYLTPYLLSRGIDSIDVLVISHFDSDHAGGWRDLYASWQPKRFISSQNMRESEACVKGEVWQWGNISIDVLWPPSLTTRAYNPHSCVIKLSHMETQQSVLLTGDIERIAEWTLIREPEKLAADVMLVPHHGSRTSSLTEFIEIVEPEYAIASTAKLGRWNLPNQEVVRRYHQSGVKWIDTGSAGQVMFDFYPDRIEQSVLRTRKGNSWYRQMLRKGVE